MPEAPIEMQPPDEEAWGYGGHIKKEEREDVFPVAPFSLPDLPAPEFFEFMNQDAPGAITSYSWIRIAATQEDGTIRHFSTRMPLISEMLDYIEGEGLTFLKAKVKDQVHDDLEEVRKLAALFEGQPA